MSVHRLQNAVGKAEHLVSDLGLNYVFRVAEAHGGTVEVESIEGEYSEFSLSLPQKRDFLDSVEEK